MGLLPEIRRAFVTIDNTLFLWRYNDPCEVTRTDALDEVITAVGLVLPRPDFFKPYVKVSSQTVLTCHTLQSN